MLQSNKVFKIIFDAVYNKLTKEINNLVAQDTALSVCVDYIPLEMYTNRANYCAITSKSDSLKVSFRSTISPKRAELGKNAEIESVLSQSIFNSALISRKATEISKKRNTFSSDELNAALVALYEYMLDTYDFACLLKASKVQLKALNILCLLRYGKVLNDASQNSELFDVPASITVSAGILNNILRECSNIQQVILDESDSLKTLIVYIVRLYATETKDYYEFKTNKTFDLNDNQEQASLLADMFTVCSIREIYGISINTPHLSLLSQTLSHMSEVTESSKKYTRAENLSDLQTAYDKYMFIANYELLALHSSGFLAGKSLYRKRSIFSSLGEYVPLAMKFDGIYNPLFDGVTKFGEPIWESLLKTSGSTCILHECAYDAFFSSGYYTRSSRNFSITTEQDVLGEEASADSFIVYIPCGVFDYVLRPSGDIYPKASDIFSHSDRDPGSVDFKYSAYLGALLMYQILRAAPDVTIFSSESHEIVAVNREFVSNNSDKTKTKLPCVYYSMPIVCLDTEAYRLDDDEYNKETEYGYYDTFFAKAAILSGAHFTVLGSGPNSTLEVLKERLAVSNLAQVTKDTEINWRAE